MLSSSQWLAMLDMVTLSTHDFCHSWHHARMISGLHNADFEDAASTSCTIVIARVIVLEKLDYSVCFLYMPSLALSL